jgi:hypothetical protein
MPTASSTLRLVGVELQPLEDVALGQQAHQMTVLQQLNPEKTGRFSLEASPLAKEAADDYNSGHSPAQALSSAAQCPPAA